MPLETTLLNAIDIVDPTNIFTGFFFTGACDEPA